MPASSLPERDQILLLLNELSSALITDLLVPAEVRPSVERLVRKARKANEKIIGHSPELKASIQVRGLDDPAEVFPSFRRWQLRFASSGIKALRDLVALDDKSIGAMKKMGPQSVDAIKKVLAPFGLRLGMTPVEITAFFGPDTRVPAGADQAQLRKFGDMWGNYFDFSIKTYALLERGGIKSLRQLLVRSEEDVAAIVGHRVTCIRDIKTRLEKLGLRLGLPKATIEHLLGPPPRMNP